MEQNRWSDTHEKLELPTSQLLPRLVVDQVMPTTNAKWSDNDCDVENDDDDSDNSWLVTTSTASTSSENSFGLDDDENDLESFSIEPETFRIRSQSDLHHHSHQHHQLHLHHQQHEQHKLDHRPDDEHTPVSRSNNSNTIHSIQQEPPHPTRIYATTTTRIHGYLSSYSDFITKAKNQEILLKLLQWSLWLIGAFIVPSSSNNRLLPQWVQKLSYDICYARYVTRLLGLPVALEGAMSGSWATTCSVQKNPSLDTTYRFIGHILAYSMVAYYPAEHAAFFLWMNPNAETILSLPAATWFYISMRCWLVYLIVEMIQCVIKYSELQKHEFAMQQSKKTDNYDENNCHHRDGIKMKPPLQQTQVPLARNSASPDALTTTTTHIHDHHGRAGENDPIDRNGNADDIDADEDKDDVTPKELKDEIYHVMILFIRNLFYIAPCINWSMSTWDTDPLLSDMALNALMWMESVLCLYQALTNASSD